MNTFDPIPGSENLMLEAAAALLDACVEKEMERPFYVITVASNGSVLVVRATVGGDGSFKIEPWAEHDVDGVEQLSNKNDRGDRSSHGQSGAWTLQWRRLGAHSELNLP